MGRRSPVDETADTSERESGNCGAPAGFQVARAGLRATGTETLCVHQETSNPLTDVAPAGSDVWCRQGVFSWARRGLAMAKGRSRICYQLFGSGGQVRAALDWPTAATWRKAKRLGCTTSPEPPLRRTNVTSVYDLRNQWRTATQQGDVTLANRSATGNRRQTELQLADGIQRREKGSFFRTFHTESTRNARLHALSVNRRRDARNDFSFVQGASLEQRWTARPDGRC